MVDIPPEIWFNIADFLSDEELVRCMGINSLFFHLSMDVLYKKTTIQTNNAIESTRMLDKLSNSLVAGRVQCLNLLLQHASRAEIEQPNNMTRIRQYLQRFIRPSKLLGSRSGHTPSRAVDVSQSSDLETMLSGFVECFPDHSRIRSLTVEAELMPMSYNFIPLFTSIRTAFGAQLRTLSLRGRLGLYQGLLESNSSFPQLKELWLWFPESFRETLHPPVNRDHLTTFVNRLSPHLEILGLYSESVLTSGLFQQLSIFPSLVHLDVNIDFYTPEDNFNFHKFLLHTSHTLQKLSIRLYNSKKEYDTYLKEWFSNCRVDSKYFAKLRSVTIHPTVGGGDVNMQCDFIHLISKTIEEYNFELKLLDNDDASLVIGALSQCPKLTVLNLSLFALTITVLDQLADAVPNLQSLGIRAGTLLDSTAQFGPSAVFFEALKRRSYADWKLKDLSIRPGYRRKANHNTMLAFGRSIPSLSSFFGDGHMDSSSCV
ncbi:hypothetical protein GALMADRAFT_210803 [Galerina marginata CBS 339.88]|uniref:F-box domain-containing protein n=1 Tax=Galerina marginata (strain CBS 339.88) TaxID=685588 RepID=A0A067TAU4_GALM3|nr:hypothetical protein GALMADRAFT_210803 [Galerina marginata CBS 339.88]